MSEYRYHNIRQEPFWRIIGKTRVTRLKMQKLQTAKNTTLQNCKIYHISPTVQSSSHFRWGRKWNIFKVNINKYNHTVLPYALNWIFFEDLSKTLEHSIRYYPPHRKSSCILYGGLRDAYHPPLRTGKAQRKSARVIRVLRVSTSESASGCEPQARSRTPKHVAVGAIPELRAPIFAGFFFCSGWVSYKPHRKRDELNTVRA